MPCPHLNITITQRSQGQSAVAGAAYQSGDTLFSEYDHQEKSYSEKRGIVYTEIMLPPNAPESYRDRNTLWNAAEKAEKSWNSQLARRFVLALPKEVPADQYPDMMREYCQEHFVSKGMCVDFAIHDKGDGNPHAHIMLTVRAIDANGKWMPKCRKIYDLDEHGNRIRLPSGNWKSHKENTVDWNEQKYAEIWRHGWEVVTNKYLENNGRPERVDLRSFERQGLDLAPTVHLGPAASQMERRGINTMLGDLNREIKAKNSLLQSIRQTIKSLEKWITELFEKEKSLVAAAKESAPITLPELLIAYMDRRRDERQSWSAYGKQQGTIKDLKKVSAAILYLRSKNINTVADLETHLAAFNKSAAGIKITMQEKERRMWEISHLFEMKAVLKDLAPIHDAYVKLGFKKAKEKYAAAHNKELEQYDAAFRFVKAMEKKGLADMNALRKEYQSLKAGYTDLQKELEEIQTELQQLKDIRYIVRQVMPPEEKKSILEDLEEKKKAAAQRQAEQKQTENKKESER